MVIHLVQVVVLITQQKIMIIFGELMGSSPTKTYNVKVVSDSGNKYRFDDFGTSVEL